MKKIIIANWKMNPDTELEAVSLTQKIDSENLIIAPPYPFLGAVRKSQKLSKLGAQDVFWEAKGAYTGEVSVTQLKSLGVQYIVLGHSERRILGETNDAVVKKVKAVVSLGLIPVICIGDGLSDKIAGRSEVAVMDQLMPTIEALKSFKSGKIIFAYEPVWAISTQKDAKPDNPENARNMILKIKNKVLDEGLKGLEFHFIYGGSVNGLNAGGFLKYDEIEGALVGGASLKPDELTRILKI
ncbi:MAG: triosephosphate isomerase [Candidatus Pacebacteria bacterium]|nr:triosephosphate isomerase [Candidatus Paceibacterota bacterium]